MSVFKKIFCKHEYILKRQIFGDEIKYLNGKRSEWRCAKCGKFKYGRYLTEL